MDESVKHPPARRHQSVTDCHTIVTCTLCTAFWLTRVVARKASPQVELTERDLSRWRLVEDFKTRLAQAAEAYPLHPTWSDPERLLHYPDYLSLFLLGLLNPVVRTLRGLCSASHLQRVQQEVCSRPVSLGSFSESQGVLNPGLLAEVFRQLSQELPVAKGRPIRGTALAHSRRQFVRSVAAHVLGAVAAPGPGAVAGAAAFESGLGAKRSGSRAPHAGQRLRAGRLAHAMAAGRRLRGRPLLREKITSFLANWTRRAWPWWCACAMKPCSTWKKNCR